MENEIRLVVQALISRWRFIGGVTGAAFVLGAAFHVLTKAEVYETEVQLFVSSPRLGEDEAAEFLPEVHHVRTYEELMQSPGVIGSVYQRLEKEGIWSKGVDQPEFDSFQRQLTLKTTILDQTTRPVNYSPLITLVARARMPELAKAYADTWAAVAVDTARESLERGLMASKRAFEGQTNSYESELHAVWDETAKEQSEFNTTVLKSQLDNVVILSSKLEDQLVAMLQQRDSSQRQVESSEEALKGETPTLDLFFAPSDDVFWTLLATEGTDQQESLAGKGMIHQSVNDVYVALRQRQSEAMMALAQADAAVQTLENQLAELDTKRSKLQQDLAEHERVQKELTSKSTTLDAVYTDLARVTSYINVATMMSQSDGETGAQPLGVNRIGGEPFVHEAKALVPGSLKVLLAALVGFVVAVGYVVAQVLAPLVGAAASDTETSATS